MVMAALLLIPSNWRKSRFTSADEWINKMWYVQKKKKKCGTSNGIIFSNEINWYHNSIGCFKTCKNIMLSEDKQTQSTVLFVLHNSIYMEMIQRDKSLRTEDRSAFAGSLGRKWEDDCRGHMGTFGWWKYFLIGLGWWLHNSVSLLKIIDYYTCNR